MEEAQDGVRDIGGRLEASKGRGGMRTEEAGRWISMVRVVYVDAVYVWGTILYRAIPSGFGSRSASPNLRCNLDPSVCKASKPDTVPLVEYGSRSRQWVTVARECGGG